MNIDEYSWIDEDHSAITIWFFSLEHFFSYSLHSSEKPSIHISHLSVVSKSPHARLSTLSNVSSTVLAWSMKHGEIRRRKNVLKNNCPYAISKGREK